MKVTKDRLKQIIKEELEEIMKSIDSKPKLEQQIQPPKTDVPEQK